MLEIFKFLIQKKQASKKKKIKGPDKNIQILLD